MFKLFFIVIFLISLVLKGTRDFYKSLFLNFKYKRNPMDNFYGMIGFCGYYGSGKSMAMTDTILRYKKLAEKCGQELKIYTNYNLKIQDGQLKSLEDIERICDEKRKNNDDNYILFAIDELQNCMSSRNWNETKKLENLLPIFTMTRKLKVMFLYTSPVLSMSDKNIRISSRAIYICKKLNRHYFVRWRVNPVELEGNLKEIKMSLIPSDHTLLTDEMKNSYDSFAFIETLKKMDYLKHSEMYGDNVTNVTNIVNGKRKK